jgi:hypothetical protein
MEFETGDLMYLWDENDPIIYIILLEGLYNNFYSCLWLNYTEGEVVRTKYTSLAFFKLYSKGFRP